MAVRVLSWDVGLRTLSYCLLTGTWADDGTMQFNVEHWDSIDVQTDAGTELSETGKGAASKAKRAKVAAVSVEDGARLVMDTLHRRASLFQQFGPLNHIIIEQQPAGGHNRHSNVRMKVVSHVIQCYFYTRGLFTEAAPEISFVSPASKLVDMKDKATRKRKKEDDAEGGAGQDEASEEKPKQKVESNYVRNKKYAVAKTAELVATLPPTCDARALFTAASTVKKDDLADAFLLGYYFLQKQAPKRGKRLKKNAGVLVTSAE